MDLNSCLVWNHCFLPSFIKFKGFLELVYSFLLLNSWQFPHSQKLRNKSHYSSTFSASTCAQSGLTITKVAFFSAVTSFERLNFSSSIDYSFSSFSSSALFFSPPRKFTARPRRCDKMLKIFFFAPYLFSHICHPHCRVYALFISQLLHMVLLTTMRCLQQARRRQRRHGWPTGSWTTDAGEHITAAPHQSWRRERQYGVV